MGAQINLPFFQFPLRWVRWLAVEPLRYWAGTTRLRVEMRSGFGDLNSRCDIMADLLHMIVAHISGDWPAEQRERAQRLMGGLYGGGASRLRPTSNPLTETDVHNIQSFAERFQALDTFTPEEAIEFKRLAEIVLDEHEDKDLGKDLLRMGWFAYAVYALGPQLRGEVN